MTVLDSSTGSLIDAFDRQAERHGGRTAVRARDGELTYAQLADRSRSLAGRLVGEGCGPESVVPLLCDRTTSWPLGVLAILRAGGAWLPLSPEHPGARTARLVRDADCRLLLTPAALAADAAEREDTRDLSVLPIQDSGGADGGARECPPPPARRPESLAYVLPTSGSTGEPKGVMIEDRNVLNLVGGLRDLVSGAEPSRIGLVALPIFDASVQQIFLALLSGSTLVVASEDTRADGARLRRFWHEERIDVCDGTPAHLRMASRATRQPRISTAHLLIGGDTLTTDVCREFAGQCEPGVRVTNVYGVAECAVDTLAADYSPDHPHDTVPIGRPLPGGDVTLISDDGSPVRGDGAGEISIGGNGVGRGYLGLPGLTAERFVPDPDRPGRRRFRTGDRARRLPDGRLAFVGRIDRQFKLRGQRVEPGEVESAMRQYRAVPETGGGRPCLECLLTDAYPGVEVTDGVCGVCRAFRDQKERISPYFGTPDDLTELVRRHTTRDTSGYDVLLLFSGGKDSTYVLYKLVELGLSVLAFTFDNGFISPAAFDNIRRITERTGVDLEIGGAARMDEIFAESLRTDSTVCSGCFRGLTADSTRLAQERGIGVVMTGLSRGQIYDTKLRRLVDAGITDPGEIDERLGIHRSLYHARRDRTAELLQIDLDRDRLERTQFVDYFRYDAVTTAEVLEYLVGKDDAWSSPTDTGMCSTNCRINEVGIYVHSIERGFHNYAAPLSWDVRWGVLEREQGLRELASVAPRGHIAAILRRLGYTPHRDSYPITDVAVTLGRAASGEKQIWAHYTTTQALSEQELRDHLADRLPAHMVPARFVRMAALPVTPTGKVDLDALPPPDSPARHSEAPRTETERRLAAIWSEVLGIDSIGRDDDFFLNGGDSMIATIVAGLVEDEFGVSAPVADLFAAATIAEVAPVIDAALTSAGRAATSTAAGAAPWLLLGDVWGSTDAVGTIAGLVPDAAELISLPGVPYRAGSLGIDGICDTAAERVRQIQPRGPYRLAAWSFGALIALGVAARLAATETVSRLIVIDPNSLDPRYWRAQAREWRGYLDQTAGDRTATGAGVPRPRELRELLQADRAYSEETVRSYAVAIAPIIEALARFDAPPPVPVGRTVLVRPAAGTCTADDAQVWRSAVRGDVEVVEVGGDHFSVVDRPPRELAECFASPG